MTDILIRICVGACGGTIAVASIAAVKHGREVPQAVLISTIGLVTILRALGVL
jgi:hypothetical protein